MNNKLVRIAFASLGLVALGGLAIGVVTLFSGGGTASAQGPGNGEILQHVKEVFASNLGVSVDQLNTAMVNTRNQLVDEALAANKITADQAAKLKSADVGDLARLFMARHDRKHDARQLMGKGVIAATAQVLNVEPQAVIEQLKAGQSLAQIAQAKGVSRDALKSGIISFEQQKLQQAVQSGRLTQPQADKIIQNLTEHLDEIIDKVHQPRP